LKATAERLITLVRAVCDTELDRLRRAAGP
jgi:hypothetical protein